jgi:hypothetical protein
LQAPTLYLTGVVQGLYYSAISQMMLHSSAIMYKKLQKTERHPGKTWIVLSPQWYIHKEATA